MSTPNSAAISRFASKVADSGKVLARNQQESLKAAAMASKTAFLSAPGAPLKMGAKKVGVRFDLKPGEARVFWYGPVHLVNNPTKAHIIRPRKYAGTRGSGKRAQKGAAVLAAFGVDATSGQGGIKLADGQIRRSVHHPGTKGKHFYEKGRAVAEQIAPDVYAHSNVLALAKHLTGG